MIEAQGHEGKLAVKALYEHDANLLELGLRNFSSPPVSDALRDEASRRWSDMQQRSSEYAPVPIGEPTLQGIMSLLGQVDIADDGRHFWGWSRRRVAALRGMPSSQQQGSQPNAHASPGQRGTACLFPDSEQEPQQQAESQQQGQGLGYQPRRDDFLFTPSYDDLVGSTPEAEAARR